MGKTESKVDSKTGVIVNEIEIIETPKTTNILLIILVLIAIGETVLKLIDWHRRSLKRKYIKRAISTEQV